MDNDDFGFSESDFDWDTPADDNGFLRENRSTSDRADVEALEQWFRDNERLWELGIYLAETARQYRREYAHLPFNETGWFSPN